MIEGRHEKDMGEGEGEDKDATQKTLEELNRQVLRRARAWRDRAVGQSPKKATERDDRDEADRHREEELAAASCAVLRTRLPPEVYVARARTPVYVAALGAAAAVVHGWWALGMGWAGAALSVGLVFLAVDAYSGVLHTVLDHPGHTTTPLIGRACVEFLWHHQLPHDIAVKPYIESCGDLNVIVATLVGSSAALTLWNPLRLCAHDPARLWAWTAYCAGLAVAFAYLGQWSHRSAHRRMMMDRDRDLEIDLPRWSSWASRATAWLQRAGLLMSPRVHALHHRHPAGGTQYSILTGATEPVLAGLRACLPPSRWPLAWLALWALATATLVAGPAWLLAAST